MEALFLPFLPLLTLEKEETGKKEHKTNPICLSTPGRERGEEGEREGGEKGEDAGLGFVNFSFGKMNQKLFSVARTSCSPKFCFG